MSNANSKNLVNHPSHKNQIAHLNRITGQLEGIKRMIEDERYCIDILVQLKAVIASTKSIENNILNTHLNHCVNNVIQSKNKEESELKVAEILKLLKTFN